MEEAEAKPLLLHIDTFLRLCEETMWIGSATETEIMNAFKLANYLETLYLKMNTNGISGRFEELLIHWWKEKNRQIPFTFSYFEEASDKLLVSFLSKVDADTHTIFTAIDTYVGYCGRTRFEAAVQALVSERICARTVFHLLSLQSDGSHLLQEFEPLVMSVWTNYLLHGKTERVAQSISEMISKEEYLPCLLKLLTMKEKNENHVAVKKLTLDKIITAATCMPEHGLCFWKRVLTSVGTETVVFVSEKYPEFLSAFLEFAAEGGKSMTWEIQCFLTHGVVKWVSAESKTLTGEEFDLIVKILKCLANSELIGYRIIAWLNDLICKSDFPWRDVKCMCVSKN